MGSEESWEEKSWAGKCPHLAKVLENLHVSGNRNSKEFLARSNRGLGEDGVLKIRSGDTAPDTSPVFGIDTVEQTKFDLNNAVSGLLSRVLGEINANLPEIFDPEAKIQNFDISTDLTLRAVEMAGAKDYDVSAEILLGLQYLQSNTRERVHGLLSGDGTLWIWHR